MHQVNSPVSSQVLVTNHPIRHSGKSSRPKQSGKKKYPVDQRIDAESDDAVTSKTPTVKRQKDLRLSHRSTDEEMIRSDGDMSASEELDNPQYTSASSDGEEIEQNKNAPSKGRKVRHLSQSLIMDENQIQGALKTFSASKSLLNNGEQSSIQQSQASRITDSTPVESAELPNHGLKSKPNRPKKEQNKSVAKMNLDAEFVNKPFTRSKAKILASQNSQSIESNPPTTCAEDCIIPAHAPAPSGSRLTMKRLKN